MIIILKMRAILGFNSLGYAANPLAQSFPTFFQPRHTFLEPLTRRHTAFMTLNLYTRLTIQDLHMMYIMYYI